MPLVYINDGDQHKLEGTQPMLVFSDSGRSMGLVVDEIVDIVEDSIVFVEGRLEREGEETAMLLDSLRTAQSIVNAEVSALVLRLEQADASRQQAIDRIKRLASAHKGDQRLMLEITDGDETWRIRTGPRFSVRLTDELLDGFAESTAAGVVMRGQVGARAVGILLGLQATLNPFMTSQAYRDSDEMEAALGYQIPTWCYSRIGNPSMYYFEQTLALLEGYGGDIATACCARPE